MPVVFRCFYCRGKLSIARRKAGQDVECPRCQAIITVPAPDDLGEELTQLLTSGEHRALAAQPAPEPPAYDLDRAAATAFDGGVLDLPPPVQPPKPRLAKKPAPKPKPPRHPDDMPLFEADEIEQLLASKIGPEPPPMLPLAPSTKPAVDDFPNVVTEDAFVVSRAKATLLMIGAVLAVGLAFVAGFVVRGW